MSDEDYPTKEGDATLISAAPEMLEALKAVELHFESEQAFDDLECFVDDPETSKEHSPLWIIRKFVRRAIEKAEGE